MTQIQTRARFADASAAQAFYDLVSPRPDDFNVSHMTIDGPVVTWEPTMMAEAEGLGYHLLSMAATAGAYGAAVLAMPGVKLTAPATVQGEPVHGYLQTPDNKYPHLARAFCPCGWHTAGSMREYVARAAYDRHLPA